MSAVPESSYGESVNLTLYSIIFFFQSLFAFLIFLTPCSLFFIFNPLNISLRFSFFNNFNLLYFYLNPLYHYFPHLLLSSFFFFIGPHLFLSFLFSLSLSVFPVPSIFIHLSLIPFYSFLSFSPLSSSLQSKQTPLHLPTELETFSIIFFFSTPFTFFIFCQHIFIIFSYPLSLILIFNPHSF